MSSSFVANSSSIELPRCGCNKTIRIFISKSYENPKRRYWKCPIFMAGNSCKLFIWDDEIDGHPPYVCRVAVATAEASPSTVTKLPCDCNCEELLKDIIGIMKDFGINKNEKLKKKLQYSRKKINLFIALLIVSWLIFVAYLKI